MPEHRCTTWSIVILVLSLANGTIAFAQCNDCRSGRGTCLDSVGCEVGDALDSAAVSVGMLSAFVGLDGSKQPQDFGVNANLGGRASVNYSAPLFDRLGIGFQVGTAVSASANAVQVFELLEESKDRIQSFTTVGVYQRTPGGFNWGAAYDFLYQESFDEFSLGQWRLQASLDVAPQLEIGTSFNLAARSDTGRFNNTPIRLEPIEMFNVFLRRDWETGVSTRIWAGFADGHNENNVITGSRPRKQNQFLFGSELFAPLNSWLAIYGEANLMMPADTGAVDAFLGVEWIPGGLGKKGRGNRFRSMFSVASSPTFSTDLSVR